MSEPRDDEALRASVREIFLNDWDPHDAARNAAAHGTYDGYIAPLLDLLRAGADEDAVVHFLKEREVESMCFPAAGSGHLRRVARKLIALSLSS